MTGLEAAACGVPAVAFDVGGIREWLTDDETGLLARGDRPEASALAEVIARALSDATTLARLGEGARRKAAGMTLERHVNRLEPVFHQAVGTRD